MFNSRKLNKKIEEQNSMLSLKDVKISDLENKVDTSNRLLTGLLKKDRDQKLRLDSVYVNKKSGQGTPQDTNFWTEVNTFKIYSFIKLEQLAAVDPIISKIIEAINNALFQSEFEILTDGDENYMKKFKKLWDKYNLEEKMEECSLSGYIHGHSFLLLDVDDGEDRYDTPLDINKVKSIREISVLNRYFLAPQPFEIDFKFNPEYYYLVQTPTINYDLNKEEDVKGLQDYVTKQQVLFKKQVGELSQQKIHYTRMLPFWGSKLQPYLFRQNMHFHDTYIRKIEQASKNYQIAIGNVASLLSKVPLPIYKIKNLMDMLSNPKQLNSFIDAMSSRETIRSTNNVSIADTEEDYSYHSPTLAGFAEMIREIKENLCSACHIPHDLLFGEGSTGATSGRTEKVNFEKFIAAERKKKVTPKIKFFMKLFEATDGLKVPEDYEIVYQHTEEQTPLEESQAFVNNANGVNILMQNGFDATAFITSKYTNIIPDKLFSQMETIKYEKGERKEI